MDDARPRSSRRLAATAAFAALALLIGGGSGFLFAWRLAPRTFARFEARAGDHAARGWDADAAIATVRREAAREARAAEPLAAARHRLRDALAAELPAGPLPAILPAGQCVARLRALARVMRARAAAAPEGSGGGTGAGLAGEALELEAVREAARLRDPALLDLAMASALQGWRQGLFDRAAGLDPRDRFLLWSEWRALTDARARTLENLADEAEVTLPPQTRPDLAGHVALRALSVESRFADPSEALSEFPAAPPRIALRPVSGFWAACVAAGALVGLAGFGLGLGLRRGAGERREAPAVPATPAAAAGDASTWLHLAVAGDSSRLGRAVCELAAHPLARKERLVVVDASRRGGLHERLRLSAKLGLADCAARGLPALGLIQSGGFTGLFLLSRGGGPLGDWLALDRVLEELRPHFDRVIVALDHDVPAVVGGVLAGRLMQGWWAGPGPAGRGRAARAADALALGFADLRLDAVPEPGLDALEARLVALAGVVSLAPKSEPPAPREPFRVSAPAVLEGDTRIQQRLRYLAWMRRMTREGASPAERS